MDDDTPGVFDEDPALDCLLLEEAGKGHSGPPEKGGCFTMLLILLIPTCLAVADLVLILHQ